MASLVHLVRHGEVENPENIIYGELPGFGLSEEGLDQAKKVARHLASRPIVAVWSSPLERALSTAAEIAKPFGLSVRIDIALGEWRGMEPWTGLKWEELPQDLLQIYLDDPIRFEVGPETLQDLARRMSSALTRVSESVQVGEIVVVSHQDPIQAARLTLTGGSLDRLSLDKPGHGSVVALRPGNPWEEIPIWSLD